MSRIHALPLEWSPLAVQPSLRGVEKTIGFLPNVFRTLAHSPAALAGYLQLSQSLSKGELNRVERELIGLAVGQVNECEYCLSAHVLYAQKAGESDEAIAAARRGEGSPVASLARKVALQRGKLSDTDIDVARASGLSDAKIVEVIANVAHLTYTNYLNNAAGTEVDFPAVAV
jgi:uncharacterized peroxidase-related enzyme